jgi:phosphatidylglycerol:prolipoprotein diacylglycerol transferase
MLAALPFPDIGPAIFTISAFGHEFSLRWYALAYIAGLLIGWRIVMTLMRRPRLWPGDAAPMRPEQVEEVLTAVILGVVIGGRLGFVLIYEPGFYLTHPLEILRLWEGGMSFHGGFLGVVVAGWWYCRRHGIPLLSAADAFALAAPPGLLLGRVANFINGELWGRPTALPWGVTFPGAAAQDCPGIDTSINGGLCARHPSQLYEAGLEGLVLGLVLWALVRAGGLKAPGRAVGVFLLGYGLSRMFVEMFRQADAQFITPDNPLGHVVGGAVVGLSMGQILSLPMVLAGLWFLIRARRAGRRAARRAGP